MLPPDVASTISFNFFFITDKWNDNGEAFGDALARVASSPLITRHWPLITEHSLFWYWSFKTSLLLRYPSRTHTAAPPLPETAPQDPSRTHTPALRVLETAPQNPPRTHTHLCSTMREPLLSWLLKPQNPSLTNPNPISIFKLFPLSRIPLHQQFPAPLFFHCSIP